MVDITQRVAHGRRRFKRLVGQHFYWKIQSELLFLLRGEKVGVLGCGRFHFWAVNFTALQP